MTSRIGEYVVTAWKPLRSSLEHSAGSFGLVIHHHIEMKLLRRPIRGRATVEPEGREFVGDASPDEVSFSDTTNQSSPR